MFPDFWSENSELFASLAIDCWENLSTHLLCVRLTCIHCGCGGWLRGGQADDAGVGDGGLNRALLAAHPHASWAVRGIKMLTAHSQPQPALRTPRVH
jgi:hypothetical protein